MDPSEGEKIVMSSPPSPCLLLKIGYLIYGTFEDKSVILNSLYLFVKTRKLL